MKLEDLDGIGRRTIPEFPDHIIFEDGIDGNRDNNHKNNLEWNTQSQNIKHAYDNNLQTKQRAVINHLSDGTVKRYNSLAEAATDVGVSTVTIKKWCKKAIEWKFEKENNEEYYQMFNNQGVASIIPIEVVEDVYISNDIEIWKSIEGLSGSVSSWGNVKSKCNRILTLSSKNRCKIDGKDYKVSKLVAKTFKISGYEFLSNKKSKVCHKDGDQKIINLKICISIMEIIL